MHTNPGTQKAHVNLFASAEQVRRGKREERREERGRGLAEPVASAAHTSIYIYIYLWQ